MPLLEMVHVIDPVTETIERTGDLSEFEVPLNKVLIGIYMRPEKTKSGMILPDQYRNEDVFQGKAGLVLKCGPLAFVDDDRIKFNGFKAEPGDWVLFRPSDGLKLDIRSKDGHCILLADTQVQMKIPAPDMVF
jgi:co-chaperonin GroES (HSP10)